MTDFLERALLENPIMERLGTFLQEGGWYMGPLIALCFLTWLVILERVFSLGDPPWEALLPSLRRKRQEARARLGRALDLYAGDPTRARREAVAAECSSTRTPLSAFYRRFFRTETPPRALRGLLLEEAALLCRLEVRRGSGLLSFLARAAALLGVLAAITGLSAALRASAQAGAHDPRALEAGLTTALLDAQVALVIVLSGVLGKIWLSRRSRVLEDDMRLLFSRLEDIARGAPRRFLNDRSLPPAGRR